MWIRKIFRESAQRSRSRKWRSTRRFQRERREKRQLEARLGLLRERQKPDQRINIEGIAISVHCLRDRYRNGTKYRFEFGRKESQDRTIDQDFGEHDLDALLAAVQLAKRYRSYVASKSGSLTG